jgi:hypothetical protein
VPADLEEAILAVEEGRLELPPLRITPSGSVIATEKENLKVWQILQASMASHFRVVVVAMDELKETENLDFLERLAELPEDPQTIGAAVAQARRARWEIRPVEEPLPDPEDDFGEEEDLPEEEEENQ